MRSPSIAMYNRGQRIAVRKKFVTKCARVKLSRHKYSIYYVDGTFSFDADFSGGSIRHRLARNNKCRN